MRSLISLVALLGATLTLIASGAAAQECDPVETQKLSEEADNFGGSVAISGAFAIVGAEYDDLQTGTAFIYRDDGGGNWIQVQKLLASDGAAGDQFGISVSISSDFAIVGAHLNTDRGQATGSAYVFEHDGLGNWNEVAKLIASDASLNNYFGCAVAISGDTAVVGALGNGERGSRAGAAYFFRRDQLGNWIETDKVTANDGSSFAAFGSAVAIDRETALIGAGWDESIGWNYGSAYVFEDSGNGTWSQVDKLTASDPVENEFFGWSVGISDGIAILGTYRTYPYPPGHAYLFRDDGGGNWIETHKITASDGHDNNAFGESVALNHGMAIVGARGDDELGHVAGAAYLFDAHTGEERAKIIASDGVGSQEFGLTVAIERDRAIIGARGSAYVFDLNCGPTLRLIGSCPGRMGFAVEGAESNARVAYLYARGEGAFEIPPGNPCAGTVLGLNRTVELADVVRADDQGVAVLETSVPYAACGRVYVQAIELDSCTTTNVVLIN